MSIKGYVIGPKAVEALGRIMQDKSVKPAAPLPFDARLSGKFMPFEITEDWEQKSGEEAYSCKAKLVYWTGSAYKKEDSAEAFEYTLYDPASGNDKPSYSSGDTVFAVIRGEHWEIVSTPGEGGTFESDIVLDRLVSTVSKTEPGLTAGGVRVCCPFLYMDRTIPSGTFILRSPVTPYTTNPTNLPPNAALAPYIVLNAEYLDLNGTMRTPVVTNDGTNLTITNYSDGYTYNWFYNNYGTPVTTGTTPAVITPPRMGLIYIYMNGSTVGNVSFTDSPAASVVFNGGTNLVRLTSTFPDTVTRNQPVTVRLIPPLNVPSAQYRYYGIQYMFRSAGSSTGTWLSTNPDAYFSYTPAYLGQYELAARLVLPGNSISTYAETNILKTFEVVAA
ncbi:MAG: hypothetical protein LBQ54_02275 [Planctomycetaceae bacterium]|jgi:hypothetical protein|nr:hypothetical protein [Planctomycetaceae bacterium]